MNEKDPIPSIQRSNEADSPALSRRSLLIKTLLVWLATMALLRVFHELQRVPFFRENVMLFTGLTLIYVPVFILWRAHEKMTFFENSGRDLGRSIAWFLLTSAVILPLVELGNRYFQNLAFHNHYVGGNYRGLATTAAYHLFLVALPEEFFFRGFLQVRLDQVWGRGFRFLGAQVGKGLWVTSALFAISHSFLQQQWWHFAIFFPAMVFGWLRERTGAITASILFHASCNVYSAWVILNYRH